MLGEDKIRNFYRNGFGEAEIHRRWPRLWNKHYRIESSGDLFKKLNRFRDRLNFNFLRRYCMSEAPLNVYMSVMNWLMPERVGEKRKARHAYPIDGEYVVDIDANTVWRPHSHLPDKHGVCYGCLSLAQEAAVLYLDRIRENYSDLHIIFSGKKGFHIHVWDFDPRDWTTYNESNPLKSHEVARYRYSLYLKSKGLNQNKYHFTLSSDVTRIITFPGSLNGETGLICSYLGGPGDFERMYVSRVVWEAEALKYFFDLNWARGSELYAHPEPSEGL